MVTHSLKKANFFLLYNSDELEGNMYAIDSNCYNKSKKNVTMTLNDVPSLSAFSLISMKFELTLIFESDKGDSTILIFR